MPIWLLIVIISICVAAGLALAIYFLGKKAEKRNARNEADIERTAQPMTFYVIDKKKLRLKNAGLPKMAYDQANFMAKIGKIPIVKAKIGNKVMNLVCDAEVYKTILPKQEVQAMVSGIYVKSAKRLRGPIAEQGKVGKNGKKKVSFIDRLR